MKNRLKIGAALWGFLALVLVQPFGVHTGSMVSAASTISGIRATPRDGKTTTQQSTRTAVWVGGRVLCSADPASRGHAGAIVTLTDLEGTIRTTRTNPFGFYRFKAVLVGEMYVISVTDKRFLFEPQMIGLTEEVTDLNFVALPR